jgi:DNA-binding transcriptional MerR regulator
MKNEYRTHTYGGIDRAGESRKGGPDSLATGNITIGELARESGVTLRALRFYQSKGLLAPHRDGGARVFSHADRDRLALILQGKRLGFTLTARARGCANALPISRRKFVEQINMLERQRRDVETALAELRQIYTEMFTRSDAPPRIRAAGSRKG